ncbi:unnamed protein product [Anisakis simplex]|uniref:Pigment dispersing factor 1b (inferred by orthology to a C. elegans protein) n=1 Tax=Anisakis simplex TaxID=6269 RepID=A0A0M3JWE1_ANISI|nr:unnamed protein product [Anisakis simplex]
MSSVTISEQHLLWANVIAVRKFDDIGDLLLAKRSNAELINGLIGMDLNKLSAIGKRSNAELINGLLGMNLNRLSSAGRR